MNYLLILTIVSGIVSILSLFIPNEWRSKKLFIVILLCITTFCAGWLVQLNSHLSRILNISQSATELASKRYMFSDKGYIQAGLAFMEQNSDIYPDSYQQAKEIYNQLKDKWFSGDIHDLATEMEGLISGIAILNRD